MRSVKFSLNENRHKISATVYNDPLLCYRPRKRIWTEIYVPLSVLMLSIVDHIEDWTLP